MSPRAAARALPLAAVLLVAAWAGIRLADPISAHPVAFVLLYGLAFGAFAMAARVALRAPGRVSLPLVLGVGLALRLLAFGGTPGDDVHRYLWEARVVAAGHSPYRLAPDDPTLVELADDDPDHASVNHPGWPAIYPPLMQLFQAAVVVLHDGAAALKLAFLLVEAGLVALLLAWLRGRGLPDARLLIYLWNPLAVLATALEGHHDVVGATLLVAALLLLERRRTVGAAVAFAAAVLSKGFALAALPVLAWRRTVADGHPRLRARLPVRAWCAALLLVVASSVPFLLAGGGLLDSLLRFGSELHANDTLHALAMAALGPRLAPPVLALAGLALATFVVLRERDPAHGAAVLLGGLLLLLPTLHPWYLVALLPLLVLFPWWGWLALSGTVALTWLPHLEIATTGRWVEWPVLRVPEYAPLLIWLLLVLVRGTRRPSPTIHRAPW